jgi:Chaperone of endosialidase
MMLKQLNIKLIVVCLCVSLNVFPQGVPQGFNYQTTVRTSTGNILPYQAIQMQFSLYSTSPSGTLQWQENKILTTDVYGAIKTIIGTGTSTGAGAAASFNQINWAGGVYYLKVSMDIAGGTNFIQMGETQLFSVPYAFYSQQSGAANVYSLSSCGDVNLAGITTGYLLKYNGNYWVPAIDNHHDTVSFAYNSGSSLTCDTALYTYTSTAPNTVWFAYYSDTAQFAYSSQNSINSNHSTHSDTALYAFSPDAWNRTGNTIGTSQNYAGTNDANDFVFKTVNTERMRIKSNGDITIGSSAHPTNLSVFGNDGLLAIGTVGSGLSNNIGAGDRMLWLPAKGSFRAGVIDVVPLGDSLGMYSMLGGYNNTAGDYSFASGNSCVTGDYAIAMGRKCRATSRGVYPKGTGVALGDSCVASATRTVAIGRGNVSSSTTCVTIGQNNKASGSVSTAIGYGCTANGVNSISIGYHAVSNFSGTFVYSDASTSAPTSATIANQFMVRATGGLTFYTDPGMTMGVSLSGGSGLWSSVSDRKKKANFMDVDYEDMLNKISLLKITSWNYKAQSKHIRHIGPMAQDFYKVFKVGENNISISTVDMDGVVLSGVKGLSNRVDKLKSLDSIDEIKQKIEEVNNTAELNKRLDAIEAALNKKNNN